MAIRNTRSAQGTERVAEFSPRRVEDVDLKQLRGLTNFGARLFSISLLPIYNGVLIMIKKPFTVVDLFCGAGGMSLGFRDAGFQLVQAVDCNEAALATYRRNLDDHAIAHDLAEPLSLPTVTVVAGGPPCQGFSSAGLRKAGDIRNSLVSHFVQNVTALSPAAFVFENVEGFLTTDGGHHVFELLEPLVRFGYRIHLRKVNAANYGVPQHRKRVIAIGGLGWDPRFPEPTHSAFGAPGARRASHHLPRTNTLAEALAGLGGADMRTSWRSARALLPITGRC